MHHPQTRMTSTESPLPILPPNLPAVCLQALSLVSVFVLPSDTFITRGVRRQAYTHTESKI